MKTKLVNRLPQSADRMEELQSGIEAELRRRLQLSSGPGIISADGTDIDTDVSPLSLSINAIDSNAVDVSGGTVVFSNGEYVDVAATDIQSYSVSSAITDAQVFRLEYGERSDGDLVTSTYYNFAAQPKIIKKPALEMLVVETVTAFNAQPADVLTRSVVIGITRIVDGVLTVDNGRDTYSFSRPWASPIDAQHRSLKGSGVATSTNPHATSLNDLTSGNYTAWQALVGQPSCILARPNGIGKTPGQICTETIPAGSFVSDPTGLVTGIAGSSYAPMGKYPDRLLKAVLTADGVTRVAAWIPEGRKVIAVADPVNFAVAANIDISYSWVQAGSLPGSIAGVSEFSVAQPTANELVVAGGNLFTAFSESKVIFTDIGTIPMKVDICVDGDGKVYKSPDVVYCNTSLDTLGAGAQPFTIQPKVATRLRVAISNYLQGFTQISFLISGVNEAGATISETVSFTGPAPLPVQTSFSEVTFQRLFTANTFASITQIQTTVRNGDGPNTTVTIFAEYSPGRPGQEDDLLLATVQWTGSEVNDIYSNDADVVLDRRLVTRGGGAKGAGSVDSALNLPMIADSVLGYLPAGVSKWVTLAEDFNNPQFVEYPNDLDGVLTGNRPAELTANSIGARHGYISRLIPVTLDAASLDALWLRMIPKSMRSFPARLSNDFQITVELYHSGGIDTFAGTLGPNPYPPYQVSLAGPAFAAQVYYAARVIMHVNGVSPRDLHEALQGFIFHARS